MFIYFYENDNNNNRNEKKIFVLQNGWATAQLYCEIFCIAMQGSVLQDSECSGFNCVAIQWDWIGGCVTIQNFVL